MSSFVIVTETGGDIPADVVDEYGIELVPMHVSFGGDTYDDGSFPAANVFSHYEKTGELPKTSGCTPQDFEIVFSRIFEANPSARVIYLAYSAVTTCSYESARIAANGDERITFIDTKSVTAGQALIVESIARFVNDNPSVSVPEIVERANDLVSRSRMAFIPGGLEFLRAGGRLSNTAYLGAQLLRIKPVIEVIDGKLVATKKLRGSMKKAVLKMVGDFISAEPKDSDQISLIRNDGLGDDIQQEVEAMVSAAGFKKIRWIDTGSVIASHCGPGSFGIAAFSK